MSDKRNDPPFMPTEDPLMPKHHDVPLLSPLQGEEKKLDESIPGGRYMVNGVLVDCNGKEIKA